MLRRRLVMMVSGFYRWLNVILGIRMKTEAKADHAPGTEIEGSGKQTTVRKAFLLGRPVADVKLQGNIRLACVAGLMAYLRAAVVYVSKIWATVSARIGAAVGTVTKYIKSIKMACVSKADSADSETTDASADVVMGTVASGVAVPTDGGESVPVIIDKTVATADTASAIGMNIQTDTGMMNHGAKIVTWIAPEVVNGVLILRQAHATTMNNGVLEVR